MDYREKGFCHRNCKSDDYSRFRLWWTCKKAIKKIIASPVYKGYPRYLRECLEKRAEIISTDNSYYNIIGLPRGMELFPFDEGKKVASFIRKENLVAVAVEKEDWDKIKVPPGFITDLNYKLLTKIPK